MRDEIVLGIVGVVCISLVGTVYMVVFKQNGAVLATLCGAIGAIIGGIAGYAYKKA